MNVATLQICFLQEEMPVLDRARFSCSNHCFPLHQALSEGLETSLLDLSDPLGFYSVALLCVGAALQRCAVVAPNGKGPASRNQVFTLGDEPARRLWAVLEEGNEKNSSDWATRLFGFDAQATPLVSKAIHVARLGNRYCARLNPNFLPVENIEIGWGTKDITRSRGDLQVLQDKLLTLQKSENIYSENREFGLSATPTSVSANGEDLYCLTKCRRCCRLVEIPVRTRSETIQCIDCSQQANQTFVAESTRRGFDDPKPSTLPTPTRFVVRCHTTNKDYTLGRPMEGKSVTCPGCQERVRLPVAHDVSWTNNDKEISANGGLSKLFEDGKRSTSEQLAGQLPEYIPDPETPPWERAILEGTAEDILTSATLERASQAEESGKTGVAVQAYRDWAEASPTFENYLEAAKHVERLGNANQAEYLYNSALNRKKNDPEAMEGLKRVRAKKQPKSPGGKHKKPPSGADWATLQAARVAAAQGHRRVATTKYKEWAQKTDTYESYLEAGKGLEVIGRSTHAKIMYEQALAKRPDDTAATHARDRVTTIFELAETKNKMEPELYRRLGDENITQGKIEAGIGYLLIWNEMVDTLETYQYVTEVCRKHQLTDVTPTPPTKKRQAKANTE